MLSYFHNLKNKKEKKRERDRERLLHRVLLQGAHFLFLLDKPCLEIYHTLWEIDGETVETVSDFIFLGSKIATDGDCSHEIKRRLLLGRQVTLTPGREAWCAMIHGVAKRWT